MSRMALFIVLTGQVVTTDACEDCFFPSSRHGTILNSSEAFEGAKRLSLDWCETKETDFIHYNGYSIV